MAVKRRMYQRKKVDVDMLNAVKSVLADVLSVSPSSELCSALGLVFHCILNLHSFALTKG